MLKLRKRWIVAVGIVISLCAAIWHENSSDPLNRWLLKFRVASGITSFAEQQPTLSKLRRIKYIPVWIDSGAGGSTTLLIKGCDAEKCKTILLSNNDIAPKVCELSNGQILIATPVKEFEILYPKSNLLKTYFDGAKLFSLGKTFDVETLVLVAPTSRLDLVEHSRGRVSGQQLSLPCRLPDK